jgi:hypothetical protein
MEKTTNPWDYKPWWCQPWSILLTGSLLIAGSWTAIKNFWVSAALSLPVLLWMVYFLLIWPPLVKAMLVRELGELAPREKSGTQ